VSAEPGDQTPSSDTVGRSGVQNFGEDRPATPASAGQRRGRRKGGRGHRGERAMVPDVEFTSYYGRPILKASPWTADIPAYLFTGGLAGGSALIAAGADLTARPGLRRVARLGALGAISASFALLVHDLGRPSRFLNMLRVAKVTSPMSVGTWILTAFAPLAGAAAAAELRDLLPSRLARAGRLLGAIERPAGLGAAVLGPALMSYTAVLMADTATPTWHEGHREMPFVFVGSSFVAAAGLGLLAAPARETVPARILALGGAALELGAEHHMEGSLGLAAETLHQGRAGTLMRLSKALTITGAAGAVFAGRNRRIASVAGAALLAASACTRFAIFEAGQASARDPKYTVVPQRARRDQREAAARSGPS
jgi:formate-dependent nitrite reductase membrane component NrfD